MNYQVTMSMIIMIQVDLCYPEITGPYKPVYELEQTQIVVGIFQIKHTNQKF